MKSASTVLNPHGITFIRPATPSERHADKHINGIRHGHTEDGRKYQHEHVAQGRVKK